MPEKTNNPFFKLKQKLRMQLRACLVPEVHFELAPACRLHIRRDKDIFRKLISAQGWDCSTRQWAILSERMSQTGMMFCVNAADQPVAMVCGWSLPEPESSEIGWLTVEQAYRRQGIGRFLIFKQVQALATSGTETIELEVEQDNLPALSLYRSLGFRPVSEAMDQ